MQNPSGIFIKENMAYIATGVVVGIIDITVPNNPTLLGSYFSSGWISNVAVSGNYAYVLDNHYQPYLYVVNLNVPSNPTIISKCFIPGGPCEISISGNYGYIASSLAGLQIINISDPESTYVVGGLAFDRPVFKVCAQGNYAFLGKTNYVGQTNNDLFIVNISDPTSPFLAGDYSLGPMGELRSISAEGHYAYLTCTGLHNFHIVNIGDPANPVLSGYYNFEYNANEISGFVSGNYAYLNGLNFEIINISDPSAPEVLSRSPYLGHDGIWVSDNYAYIAKRGRDNDTLKIIDISNSANPILTSTYQLPGYIMNISTTDSLVLIAAGTSLIILKSGQAQGAKDSEPPNSFSLSPNYPNPFNAQTTISYSLDQPGPVSIAVYNIMGQKAATLFDGIEQAGEHKCVWNAEDVSSGIYFARIETSKQAQSIRMMLLK
jgi:hypothetical protein